MIIDVEAAALGQSNEVKFPKLITKKQRNLPASKETTKPIALISNSVSPIVQLQPQSNYQIRNTSMGTSHIIKKKATNNFFSLLYW
jgi:hypothetical protein